MITQSSLSKALRIVSILDSKKAKNIRVLHIEAHSSLADYFVICEGTSNTQLRSLADEVEYRLSLDGISPLGKEGVSAGEWTLLDYGEVIVHIFQPETRSYFNLEKLWQDATEVELSTLLPQGDTSDGTTKETEQ